MVKRILVADDEEIMRRFLKEVLGMKYEICGEAKNGEEAVEKVEDLDPDLVLLDIQMPKMDGYDAFSQIKKIYPEQNVIFCTSVDKDPSENIDGQYEPDDYIVKPFKRDKLLRKINDVL
ncbi:MAG: response regulator [Thermoplasmatota archaeon]